MNPPDPEPGPVGLLLLAVVILGVMWAWFCTLGAWL